MDIQFISFFTLPIIDYGIDENIWVLPAAGSVRLKCYSVN